MTANHVQPAPVADTGIAGPLAEQLLNHLSDETTSFSAMLVAVRGVNSALQHVDDVQLEHWIETERRELASILALQERRHQLQDELAPHLNLKPSEITFRRLVQLTSGSLRDAIDRGRRSLAEMSAELDRLNRQNTAMINLSMSIAKGVIDRLAGMKNVGESYTAIGGKAETHVGPLLQWGG